MQNDKIKQLELEGQRLRLELERYKVGIFFVLLLNCVQNFFKKVCNFFPPVSDRTFFLNDSSKKK